MEKRLKNYLKQMEEMRIEGMSPEERRIRAQALLIQIGFFQHERLIHLIVTVTFAVLTMLAVMLSFELETVAGFLLPITFLILLIPYIRHYYILENGVQRLYSFYDRLIGREQEVSGGSQAAHGLSLGEVQFLLLHLFFVVIRYGRTKKDILPTI